MKSPVLCAVSLSTVLCLASASVCQTPLASPVPPRPDLVVYGATAAGVFAAYSAAREGLHVVLLEPGEHVGGMATGGLSGTDLGDSSVIGGYVREFYKQAATHYGLRDLAQPENWKTEPRVDEAIFRQMLRDVGVQVRFHQRLRDRSGVTSHSHRIASITTQDGSSWPAKVFADCSYEGDLMAQAGVKYTWGREGSQQSGPLAAPGTGDRKVQSYNFRLILTNDPLNRLPFPRPAWYDRSRFVLLERYIAEFPSHTARPPRLSDLFLIVPIQNHKADFNNNGPFSTDYIGHSWRYPEASYVEKAAIWQAHLNYTQSLLYFVSQDKAVPKSLRDEMNNWGLPKDEFVETAHWPFQLYVREGRRMIGAYVMRQQDLQSQRTKPDSIAMGSYNSDSHNVQRVTMHDGTVRNEGNVEVPVEPYEIPYRSIAPKKDEAENLLVPVCLSATHAAYSSVRMEPQYMMIGQAAGVAAALAVKGGVAVQDIPIPELQKRLRAHGAILHLSQAAH